MATDRYIPSLDGLRAISILLVVLEHLAITLQWGGAKPSTAVLFMGNAQIGVSIFFVISGYLITRLLLRELDETGDIKLSRFYVRRAFRILPAFYTYLLVLWILTGFTIIRVEHRDLLVAGSFLWNYVHTPSSWEQAWWVGHSWSLSVEEQFYLLWPFTLLLLGRERAGRLCAALIVGVPVARVASYFLFPAQRGYLGMMLHTRVDTLMFGCGLALVEGSAAFRAVWSWLLRWRAPILSALFIALAPPLLVARFRGEYSMTVGQTLEGSAIAIVIYWAVVNARSRIGLLLNSPLVVHIGVISYSLYLWQQLFAGPHPVLKNGGVLTSLVGMLVAAECSYWFIERRFLSIRNRLRQRASGFVPSADMPTTPTDLNSPTSAPAST